MSGRAGWASLLLRNRLALAGLAVLLSILALALAAPVLPLAPPDITDPANRLLPPGTPGHLLGTDHLGRDALSRLVWGSRVSLAVGVSATLVAALIGSLIGIVAGFHGRLVDSVLMRGIDMLMAFPYILLALAIVAVLGPGLMNALLAISVVNIPFFARNIRGVTLGLARREFVDAARLSGKSDLRILASDILPNVMPVIVITMSTTVGWMILETAGLSFLGLGAQPPQADLGSMLGEGRKLLINAPHVAIVPGAMIFILVMSINLVGDGVRDALDPRLRAGALARPGARTRVARPAGENFPPPPGGQALAVQGLRTEFSIGGETYPAVDGVDLMLRRHECLGIIGESGSGKSVTALSLAGLVASPPGEITGGRVMFDGKDLLGVDDETLRGLRGDAIGYIFQDPLSTLHPLFPVGDQIAEAIRAHRPVSWREAHARAVALLDLVRIPAAASRASAYPHELSGGMRQRVGIAMALAGETRLLIADEPTTALDVTVQAQVLRLLDELREERGAALLFITHDMGVVSQVSDRIAVMYAGRIVETGPTDEVLQDPAHPYTRKLIDAVPRLGDPDHVPEAIPGMPPPLNRLPQGCAFADRCFRAEPACRAARPPLAPVGRDRTVRCIRPLVGEHGP